MARLSNLYAGVLRSLNHSERYNAVSHGAANLFHRILAACDRNGAIEAEPLPLWARVLRRRQEDLPHIDAWIAELEAVDLVRRYEAEGMTYLAVVDYWLPGGYRGQKEHPEPPPEARKRLVPTPGTARPHTGDDPSPLRERERESERERGSADAEPASSSASVGSPVLDFGPDATARPSSPPKSPHRAPVPAGATATQASMVADPGKWGKVPFPTDLDDEVKQEHLLWVDPSLRPYRQAVEVWSEANAAELLEHVARSGAEAGATVGLGPWERNRLAVRSMMRVEWAKRIEENLEAAKARTPEDLVAGGDRVRRAVLLRFRDAWEFMRTGSPLKGPLAAAARKTRLANLTRRGS